MTPTYLPYDPETVHRLRAGGPDAYGNPAERLRSDGAGNPCRSCLDYVPEGAAMLVAAARPFAALQPYAETGPIFLCAACAPWTGTGRPPVLTGSATYLVKGYDKRERIVYGSGRIVAQADVDTYVGHLLAQDGIAFVDLRSASNNCFITRAFAPT